LKFPISSGGVRNRFLKFNQ